MEKTYPPELEHFIQQELAAGNFQSETELVNRALEVYRELKLRHDTLRADVERSLAEADRGEATPLDIEEVIARGTGRLAQEGITDA